MSCRATAEQAGGEPGGRTQPAPQAPRDGQYQAGERRFRRLWRVGPRCWSRRSQAGASPNANPRQPFDKPSPLPFSFQARGRSRQRHSPLAVHPMPAWIGASGTGCRHFADVRREGIRASRLDVKWRLPIAAGDVAVGSEPGITKPLLTGESETTRFLAMWFARGPVRRRWFSCSARKGPVGFTLVSRQIIFHSTTSK